MKNAIISAFMLLATIATAQNFEGTAKWTIKTEFTDPAMKAKMAESQRRMNDPATQAQMKEMQEKMNDPQMKAMMEANPQMKAQMESMMKMSQGGDMSSMVPTGMTMKIKDQNTLTKMEGGMADIEILYMKGKDQSISLNRANKTYTIMSSSPAAKPMQTKVTKTNETAKVLNYTCTKYLVEMTENGRSITNTVWATTEIKDFNLKSLSSQRMGSAGQSFNFEDIDGVPLKMEMNASGMKMTMEASEIKKESLSASEFTIPADFKEVKGVGMRGR